MFAPRFIRAGVRLTTVSLTLALSGCVTDGVFTKPAIFSKKSSAAPKIASTSLDDPMLAAPPGAAGDPGASGSRQVSLAQLSTQTPGNQAPASQAPAATAKSATPPATSGPFMLVPPASGTAAPIDPMAAPPPPTAAKPGAASSAVPAAMPAKAEPAKAEMAAKAEPPKPAVVPPKTVAASPPAPPVAPAPAKVPAPMEPAKAQPATPAAQMKLTIPPKGSAPAVTGPESNDTVVISSTSAEPVKESREFIPALVAVNSPAAAPSMRDAPGSMVSRPLTAAEKNIAQRFEALKRLLDESLITPEEYARHRAANLGALLPYTHDPAAVGLERPVPGADAIVARLEALGRSLEMRAISTKQHAMERSMIINALLPEMPTDRMAAMPPPEDVIQAATIVSHLQALRDRKLVSEDEFDAERRAIERYLRTGAFAPPVAKAEPVKAAPKPAEGTKTEAELKEEQDLTAPVPGPVLHLASFRSQDSAKKAWQEALTKNKAVLSSVKQIIRRIDLGQERGVFYRLMAGPYASIAAAESACIQLKQANQFCRASADGS